MLAGANAWKFFSLTQARFQEACRILGTETLRGYLTAVGDPKMDDLRPLRDAAGIDRLFFAPRSGNHFTGTHGSMFFSLLDVQSVREYLHLSRIGTREEVSMFFVELIASGTGFRARFCTPEFKGVVHESPDLAFTEADIEDALRPEPYTPDFLQRAATTRHRVQNWFGRVIQPSWEEAHLSIAPGVALFSCIVHDTPTERIRFPARQAVAIAAFDLNMHGSHGGDVRGLTHEVIGGTVFVQVSEPKNARLGHVLFEVDHRGEWSAETRDAIETACYAAGIPAPPLERRMRGVMDGVPDPRYFLYPRYIKA